MSNATRWVGIDLHRRRSHIAIDRRARRADAVAADRQRPRDVPGAARRPAGAETHVALEATYGWEWLAELLEEAGYDLHLAHPLRTRAIAAARVKTDAIDAQDARAAAARRAAARGLRRAARAARPARAAAPPRDADPDALRGQEPRARDPGQARHRARALRPVRQRRPRVPRRARAARRAAPAAGQPDGADRRLRPRDRPTPPARSSERAKADDRVDVLIQIRGVGRYTAMLIIAEIGDINRFPTARHLCSWAGLAPTRPQLRRQSAPRAHLPPRLARVALGAGRGRAEDHHRVRARCATSSSGSPNAAGARSPRSPSPARSSPSATTAYATERSVAWRAAAARARKRSWRSRMTRRALTAQGLRPRPRRDAHARASSTVCHGLAKHQRRPPT